MTMKAPLISPKRARNRALAATITLSNTSSAPNVPALSSLTLIPPNSRSREPPVSAQVRLNKLAHFISDNKWSAFKDHIALFPNDAKVTDPRSGRPLLYHAIELHRNDFAHFLLSAYVTQTANHDFLERTTAAISPNNSTAQSDSHKVRQMTHAISVISLNDNLVSQVSPFVSARSSIASVLKQQNQATFSSDINNTPQHSTLQAKENAFNFYSFTRDFEGNSPLIVATEAKNTDMCETLIQQWPQMLHCCNVLGMNPLLAACRVGSEYLVTVCLIKKLYLDLGANLSHADHEGDTALHHAAAYNHFSIVALLVARGVNFMVRNKKQWTAIDYAYSETLRAFFDDLVRDIVLGETNYGHMEGSPQSSKTNYSYASHQQAQPQILSSSQTMSLNDAGGWLDGNQTAPSAEASVSNHLNTSYFTHKHGSPPASSTFEPKPTLVSYNAFLE